MSGTAPRYASKPAPDPNRRSQRPPQLSAIAGEQKTPRTQQQPRAGRPVGQTPDGAAAAVTNTLPVSAGSLNFPTPSTTPSSTPASASSPSRAFDGPRSGKPVADAQPCSGIRVSSATGPHGGPTKAITEANTRCAKKVTPEGPMHGYSNGGLARRSVNQHQHNLTAGHRHPSHHGGGAAQDQRYEASGGAHGRVAPDPSGGYVPIAFYKDPDAYSPTHARRLASQASLGGPRFSGRDGSRFEASHQFSSSADDPPLNPAQYQQPQHRSLSYYHAMRAQSPPDRQIAQAAEAPPSGSRHLATRYPSASVGAGYLPAEERRRVTPPPSEVYPQHTRGPSPGRVHPNEYDGPLGRGRSVEQQPMDGGHGYMPRQYNGDMMGGYRRVVGASPGRRQPHQQNHSLGGPSDDRGQAFSDAATRGGYTANSQGFLVAKRTGHSPPSSSSNTPTVREGTPGSTPLQQSHRGDYVPQPSVEAPTSTPPPGPRHYQPEPRKVSQPTPAAPVSRQRATASNAGRAGRRPPGQPAAMVSTSGRPFLPAPGPTSDPQRLLVVLDLDETLVFARDAPMVTRPGLRDLFAALLASDCEVAVWTAGEQDYAQWAVDYLDKDRVVEHCVYRHPRWYTGRPHYSKPLKLLGRDPRRVLLVDNTPDCLQSDPGSAVLVPDFYGTDPPGPPPLAVLAKLIPELCQRSDETVEQILKTSPNCVRQRVPLDGGGAMPLFTIGDVFATAPAGTAAARLASSHVPASPSAGASGKALAASASGAGPARNGAVSGAGPARSSGAPPQGQDFSTPKRQPDGGAYGAGASAAAAQRYYDRAQLANSAEIPSGGRNRTPTRAQPAGSPRAGLSLSQNRSLASKGGGDGGPPKGSGNVYWAPQQQHRPSGGQRLYY